jgi:hypothetical protein
MTGKTGPKTGDRREPGDNDGKACENCGGSGRIIEGIGGA